MPKKNTVLLDIGQGLSLMLGMPSIYTWKTRERPKDAKRGMIGFNTETSSLECFDGEDWYTALMNKA